MIKAAFFDIDDTLFSLSQHDVPASTRKALVALHKRGIKCFIATGRSSYELPQRVVESFEGFPGFDGFITMNGSVCYDEQETYLDVPIPAEDVQKIVQQVKDGVYEVIVMGADGAFTPEHTEQVLEVERLTANSYKEASIDVALEMSVYQLNAFVPPEREREIFDVCPGVLTTRWIDLFCDVVPAASNKPAGILATLERIGVTPEETIAFGDGGNDMSMLQLAGIGVAMGNAKDEVKAVADYVTTGVDDDGIANACKHFGLM